MYTVHLHISMYNVFLDQFPLSFKRIKVLLVDTGRLLHPIEADTSPFSTKQCLRMVAVNLRLTTGAVAVPVVKLNSYDISSMAPTLAKLVENSELDLDAVNSMMLDKVQNSLTREQAACAWLKSNEDRWKATWLSRAQCRTLKLPTSYVIRGYSQVNTSPRGIFFGLHNVLRVSSTISVAATTHTVDNRTKALNEYASCTCKIKDQRAIASTRKHLCISLQCRTHTESLEYSYKIMTSLPNVLKVFICQSQTIQILNIVCDQGWIPVPTDCESGFGLYDEVSEEFVAERARATTCRACLPGMFSKAGEEMCQ